MKGLKKAIVLTDPTGRETEYDSGSAAARAHPELNQADISLMARGRRAGLKGFKARFKEPPKEPCSFCGDTNCPGHVG